MNRKQVLQLVAFNLFWLLCVLGQNDWLFVQLLLLSLVFLLSPTRKYDIQILPLAFIGFGIDFLLMKIEVLNFTEFPFWLLLLWIGFTYSLQHGLEWLSRLNYGWLAVAGSIGGALSYFAAWKLGAVAFSYSISMTVLIIALNWLWLFPTLVMADKRIRRIV